MTTIINIAANGTLRFIYEDDLSELLAEGVPTIKRASHVEWSDDFGGWCADLSPVGGPMLGTYTKRQAALDAEVAWLEEHRL